MEWVAPSAVFDAGNLSTGLALGIDHGKVAAKAPAREVDSRPVAGTLTPGLIDLQVNGGGGELFNNTPTPVALRQIRAAHHCLGTSHILPTLISDAPEVMTLAVDAVIESWGEAGLLGIHLEGPHLALARRGTHAARYVRPLDATTWTAVARLRQRDIPVMLTLAPEVVAPAEIKRLSELGVVVALGHSDADAEQVLAALAAGAQAFTHLFNAMSQVTPRAPGMVGTALNASAICSVIADGIHVSDPVLRLAMRARPEPDRMMLVSDAMATVGGGDSFMLYGQTITLRDGQLVNAEGNLAGAHLCLCDALRHVIAQLEVDPQSALRMAISTPARLIGRGDLDQLIGQSVEDLIVFDADWRVRRMVA